MWFKKIWICGEHFLGVEKWYEILVQYYRVGKQGYSSLTVP
jgi:hypothetical protein